MQHTIERTALTYNNLLDRSYYSQQQFYRVSHFNPTGIAQTAFRNTIDLIGMGNERRRRRGNPEKKIYKYNLVKKVAPQRQSWELFFRSNLII